MFLSFFQKIVDGGIIFENKMPKRGRPPLEEDILQGTLDMLILRMLGAGPAHGHTIAHAIEHRSEQVLRVGKWLSLSGVASVGRPRLDLVFLGDLGKQPESEVLPVDSGGPKAVGRANRPMGATHQGD